MLLGSVAWTIHKKVWHLGHPVILSAFLFLAFQLVVIGLESLESFNTFALLREIVIYTDLFSLLTSFEVEVKFKLRNTVEVEDQNPSTTTQDRHKKIKKRKSNHEVAHNCSSRHRPFCLHSASLSPLYFSPRKVSCPSFASLYSVSSLCDKNMPWSSQLYWVESKHLCKSTVELHPLS